MGPPRSLSPVVPPVLWRAKLQRWQRRWARSRPSLRERAELLDLAFDAVLARSFADHTITFWNPGAERLYGWTSEEALGRTQGELLKTEYPVSLQRIDEQVRSTGSWEGQLIQHAKDGRQLVVASRLAARSQGNGAPDFVLEVDRDITAQVDADRRLGEYDELFQLLVSSVREYAMFVLDPQGRILTWNEGAKRLKQYTRDEILGQHFSVFYPEELASAGKPDQNLAVADREGHYEEEGWRRRKDGSLFWASIAITALRDERGTLRGFAKVTKDLTEKYLEAQRLTELEAIKSQFLQLASHELRGPLGTLRAYSSMLEEGSLEDQPGPRAKAYHVIHAKARHMNVLVNQMLEAARLEEGRLSLSLRPLDLREPVTQACEEVRLLTPASHELQFQDPGEPIRVQGDELRLIAIVHNLLDNAVKYSPRGGTIHCRIGIEADTAVVEVSDQGLGVSREDMPTLFSRFGRVVTPANSHISGAGLSLHLCRELARMHGGDITASSEEGKGSTFRLSLPLSFGGRPTQSGGE